ncbi:MAG: glycosyltransferase family 4 protein [Planctomycetes bacterium]|nr:glycosyltransferase family 4 protein [Planctomycetota bacterium]
MKVTLVTDGLFPHVIGGIQRHSRCLALELARRGVELTVLHPTPPSLFRPEQYPFRSVYVPFPGRMEYLAACWVYSKRVRRHLEARPPDVAYAQGLTLWAGTGGARVPWALNPHGLEMWSARGAWNVATGYLFRLIMVRMARRADAVVSLGGKLTGMIRRGMRVPAGRVVVVPNAVDPSYVGRRTDGSAGAERPRLLAVGRFFPNKGFRVLVEAMNRLASTRVELDIVGKGPEEGALRSACATSRVRFLGELPDAELMAAYRTADGYVLPSLYEGMPTVLLEAMAAGLPVIATDVGAVATLVSPDTGWRVPPGDAGALATAIRAFAGTAPEERHRMGDRGAERVRARFTWERVGERTLRLLRCLAEGRGLADLESEA